MIGISAITGLPRKRFAFGLKIAIDYAINNNLFLEGYTSSDRVSCVSPEEDCLAGLLGITREDFKNAVKEDKKLGSFASYPYLAFKIKEYIVDRYTHKIIIDAIMKRASTPGVFYIIEDIRHYFEFDMLINNKYPVVYLWDPYHKMDSPGNEDCYLDRAAEAYDDSKYLINVPLISVKSVKQGIIDVMNEIFNIEIPKQLLDENNI